MLHCVLERLAAALSLHSRYMHPAMAHRGYLQQGLRRGAFKRTPKHRSQLTILWKLVQSITVCDACVRRIAIADGWMCK